MRFALSSSLACCALALAVLCLASCGSATTNTRTGVPPKGVPLPPRDEDGDIDRFGAGPYDTDNDADPVFKQVTSAADHRAIVALIKRYYAVALEGDGAQACSMLDPLLVESLLEEHERGRGPPALRGKTCAQIATKTFAQSHRELVEENTSIDVLWVAVTGNLGTSLVRFGPYRELVLLTRRTDGVWRMDVLLSHKGF